MPLKFPFAQLLEALPTKFVFGLQKFFPLFSLQDQNLKKWKEK